MLAGAGGETGCTCYRGAGVLQHAMNELQALIAMPDGPLDVELVHHQGSASCLCHPQHCLYLYRASSHKPQGSVIE